MTTIATHRPEQSPNGHPRPVGPTPQDEGEARAMLRRMSGKTHEVFTGVTLTTQTESRSFVSESRVRFATLTDEEIDYYVSHYHPLDKAGAYAIQGLASLFVEGIEGDYFNVVGLPLCRLGQMLEEFGVRLL